MGWGGGLVQLEGFCDIEVLRESERTAVYRAVRVADGLGVVLKMPRGQYPGQGVLARYAREHALLGVIGGAGAITCHGLTKSDHLPVLVLEDFGAVALEEWQKGDASLKTRLGVGLEIARCLAAVHERGVCHRDLNPSNVLVNPKTREVQLADFDVAVAFEGNDPSVGMGTDGTLAYMSPEQTGRMNRPVDHRTDIYSLGVALYELLTGELPFEGHDPLELVHAHVARQPTAPRERVSSLPQALSDIVMKCLAKNPEDRYQSAWGLQADLGRCHRLWEASEEFAPFELGTDDRWARLTVSRKLYGRSEPLSALDAALERAAQGAAEVWIVQGAEGSGKTAFLQEARRRLWQRTPFIVGGSFLPSSQNTPYAALFEGLGEFLLTLLDGSEEQVSGWRARLQGALGQDAGVLTGSVPHLEELIGATPPPGTVGEATLKFMIERAIRSLLDALRGPEEPLILLFDDLRWADEVTLSLVRHLVMEGAEGIVLVATTGPGPAAVPQLATLAGDLEAAGILHFAELIPLYAQEVAQLLADTLRVSADEAAPLAARMTDRTSGNPLAIHQMLQSAYAKGILAFDTAERRWVWSLDALDEVDVPESVAELTAARVRALSAEDRQLLAQAAALGSRFDLRLLAAMRDEEVAKTGLQLERLAGLGYVERLARALVGSRLVEQQTIYRFPHERVRQGAFAQLGEAQRAAVHLAAAEAMEKLLSPEERESMAFELADHLNAAHDLMVRAGHSLDAARANLAAGRKAWASAAPQEALRYALQSTSLLGETGWEENYSLALDAFRLRMRSEYACRRLDDALETANAIIAKAKTPSDRLNGYAYMCNVFTVRNELDRIAVAGRAALADFDITLPAHVDREDAIRAYQVVKELLSDVSTDELLERVTPGDPDFNEVLGIFSVLTNAHIDSPAWVSFITAKIVETSLRRGLSPLSSTGFQLAYPLCEIWDGQALSEASDLAEIGFRLLDRASVHDEDYTRARLNSTLSYASNLNHWRHHLRTTVDLFDTYETLTASTGRLNFALLHSPAYGALRLVLGDPLEALEERTAEYIERTGEQGLHLSQTMLGKIHSTVQALRGTGQWRSGTAVEERESDSVDDLVVRACLDSLAAYLLDRTEEAPLAPWPGYDVWEQRMDFMTFLLPEYAFYQALVLARRLEEAEPSAREEYLGRLRWLKETFGVWAEACPENYLHRHLLLQAEWERHCGEWHVAQDLYDEAIAAARRGGWLSHEAMANEATALFHLSRQRPALARPYLQEAHYLYGQWGAVAKVELLEERHRDLLFTGPGPNQRAGATGRGPSRTSQTGSQSGEGRQSHLDLASLLKTSQAISREVALSKLLSAMLEAVIENAGAQRGALVLERGGLWYVEAETAQGQEVSVLRSVPIQRSRILSAAIVQQVLRSQDVLVLHDASREGRFLRDRHIREGNVRSVLCFPVLKQGKTVAVLYLENNLASHVFTPERVEVLRLLSGQAAISIENARMYEELDQRVRERTAELEEALATVRRTQQQMLESEKMASLGQLTAGVAHEMNNPINFVATSTGPLRRDVADLLELLARYEAVIVREGLLEPFAEVEAFRETIEVDTIKTEIAQLLRGIDDGAKRTAEIVKDLRNFSRLDENDMKRADVRVGLDATLTLLRQTYEPRIRIERAYGDVPEIECYPGRLNQVFMNLLSNAIQAIPGEGEIHISVGADEEVVRVEIRDSGVGMSKEVLGRIFDPFFTTKDVGVGTGLGLAISYGIIERHRGTIHVQSAPGKGSTFTLTLPIRQRPS